MKPNIHTIMRHYFEKAWTLTAYGSGELTLVRLNGATYFVFEWRYY
jgi:hypothetical protein